MRFLTRPLRFHLSLIVVLLLVVVSLALVGINYARGRDAALAAADERMQLLADRVLARFEGSFRQATAFVVQASSLDLFATPPPEQLDGKVRFLWAALAMTPDLDTAYVGYPNGTFILAANLTNSPAWRNAVNAPAAANLAVRTIEEGQDKARESTWRFFGSDGRSISSTPTIPANYDPRTRPWYISAQIAPVPVSTSPYIMFTTKLIGITVSRSFDREPKVVVGADVILDAVRRLLEQEKVSPTSVIYVFDGTGRLVMASDAEPGQPSSEPDTRTADPKIAAVRGSFASDADHGRKLAFQIGSRGYAGWLQSVGSSSVLPGYRVAIVAPTDELTAASDLALRDGLIVSVCILLAGVLCAILVAQSISGSLMRLTADAYKLKTLDFSGSQAIRSRIAEIAQLASAMNSAQSAIRSFGLYVPMEIVRSIVASGRALRGAHREEVTALFADAQDFTAICEQLSPEEVVAMLSSYFDIFDARITRHSGTIVQFAGDSVYALWNSPVPDRNHVDNACLCALEIKGAIDTFNRDRRAMGSPALVTRIGIHTGVAVVGSVGAAQRLQFTAIGDTINVASRLEGLNKQFSTTILVSTEVVDRCRLPFEFRSLGLAKAKGRSADLDVAELCGVRENEKEAP